MQYLSRTYKLVTLHTCCMDSMYVCMYATVLLNALLVIY